MLIDVAKGKERQLALIPARLDLTPVSILHFGQERTCCFDLILVFFRLFRKNPLQKTVLLSGSGLSHFRSMWGEGHGENPLPQPSKYVGRRARRDFDDDTVEQSKRRKAEASFRLHAGCKQAGLDVAQQMLILCCSYSTCVSVCMCVCMEVHN